MFSILIPSYNNLNYLDLCIKSINKNSKYNHQIQFINEGKDGSLECIKRSKLNYTFTEHNVGMPIALNRASKLAKYNYIIISHDDFIIVLDGMRSLLKKLNQLIIIIFIYRYNYWRY